MHRIIKNIPESFGSTAMRKPDFLNTSVDGVNDSGYVAKKPGKQHKYNKIKRIESTKQDV